MENILKKTGIGMAKLLNSKALLCIFLTLPAVPLLQDFVTDDRYYAELMHISGVLASQLLVITLVMTPAQSLLRRIPLVYQTEFNAFLRWAIVRRRYFGVAAFGYALLHTMFYLRNSTSLTDILSESLNFDLAMGWVAMLILTVLAATSNDFSVERLGQKWKTLHRWVYISAAATFLHWWLLDFFLWQVLTWFTPLALLQLFRISRRFSKEARYRSRKHSAMVADVERKIDQ